jgi:hypothetical protein
MLSPTRSELLVGVWTDRPLIEPDTNRAARRCTRQRRSINHITADAFLDAEVAWLVVSTADPALDAFALHRHVRERPAL